jgi:hypothetical protein
MGTRLEFHVALEDLFGDLDNEVNLYFQPPTNVTMVYPAIVYNKDIRAVDYADNDIYRNTLRYQVTVIDRDPDSLLPDLVGGMRFSTRVRHFTTEGLHHDIFYVYF